MSHGEDIRKAVPLARTTDCPPSNDPRFKVSEGRPPWSGPETEMVMILSVFTKFNFKIPLCPPLSKWDLGGFTSRLVMLFLILIWCGVSSVRLLLILSLPKEPGRMGFDRRPRLFNRKTPLSILTDRLSSILNTGIGDCTYHPKRPKSKSR
jgi:hypothetical protein